MIADEQSIHDILKQLEAAWNASDSRRWTSFFADDATFIHIFGGQLDGHAAIEGSHRVIFDTIYKGSRLSIESRSIRFVRSDVAVVFAQMHLALAQGAPTPDFDTRPTMFMVKERGKWQNTHLGSTCRRTGRSTAGDIGTPRACRSRSVHLTKTPAHAPF